MNMQRRSFLTYLGVGWAASCFPLVLSACDTGAKKNEVDPKISKADNNSKPSGSFTLLGTVAELDKAGKLSSKDKQVLVIRDPADKSKVIAVNPACTHKGCEVKWKATEKTFECPCHDSYFAPDGKAIKGPATKPLATYMAKIEGDKVMVKLA